MKNRYIIDFDSTFTQVEALDELVKISLKGHPDKDKVLKQIEDYTNAAMEGRMSFTDSLRERVKLLGANSEHLQKLVKVLKKRFLLHSLAIENSLRNTPTKFLLFQVVSRSLLLRW